MSSENNKFRKSFYKDVSDENWGSWHWQVANVIKSQDDFAKIFALSDEEKAAFREPEWLLDIGITPYYASVVYNNGEYSKLRKCYVPSMEEKKVSNGELVDPLGENGHQVSPCLVHKYPDRVLFLVTGFCSTYCRYCTRSRVVGKDDASGYSFNKKHWLQAIDYISKNKKIRDVLISGGDPLTLSDDNLEFILSRLREIEHVECIRIGSKVPMVLPQRIDDKLVTMLKKYHPLYINIHVTHPDEFTDEANKACNMLADGGIPLGSQTVLLKDVNDDAELIKKLMHQLLKVRVKPYYLFQCDPVVGSKRFRTPISKGVEIIKSLRGFTSGYAIPTFAVDTAGGGKIPIAPDYFVAKDDDKYLFKNYEGDIFSYPCDE